MFMGKKLLMTLLSMSLALGALTGCGDSDVKESEAGNSQAVSKESKPKEEKKDEKPVSLRLIIYGSAGERNTEFWENEFHEKVLEDLNIDMDIDYLPWGSDEQVSTMLASGEKFAVYSRLEDVYVAENVTRGLYATIDEELFTEYAPAYLEARMGFGFETSKYGGDIFIIPMGAAPRSGQQDNLNVRNDILNKVGLDYTDIKTYDDLVDAALTVKEEYPDMYTLYSQHCLAAAMESLLCDGAVYQHHVTEDLIPLVATNLAEPDSDKVFSWFESQDFIKITKMLEEWYKLGLTDPDILIDSSAYENAWQSGNMLYGYGAIDRIYKHTGLNNYFAGDEDIQYISLDNGPTVLIQNYDWGWSVSSADQENVEHYVRFFNWMYESKENYLFCLYGVEGKDFTINDAGVVEKITSDSFFAPWMHSTLAYEPISTEVYDKAEVEEYLAIDHSAIVSKKAGFIFDTSAVEVEAAALNTILTEKVKPIAFGFGDVEKDFPPILEELKAAGLDKYVAEYQRQFSEFMANK